METSLALLDIQALRERGLRESAPHYEIIATDIGIRHQQFRYFMWLVCPEYLSSLSDSSVKYLENILISDSTNANQLVLQAEQFVKRHPNGVEVEGKNVPKVKGRINSKINRKFRESASRFIDEYLGIEIPAYSTVVPRFYQSIINHCVKSPSQQSVVHTIQEALENTQTSYEKELPSVTSKAHHRARYLCSLIFWEYYSGLPPENQQELEKILIEKCNLERVIQQAELFVLNNKGNMVIDVQAIPIRTAKRTPKAERQYKREASKFIQNYLGIRIPSLDELSADFYESIVYHHVTAIASQRTQNHQEFIKIS